VTKLSGPMLPPKSGGVPTQAVILLHGYGSNGADLIGLAPYWQDILPDAIFIAPNAPERIEGLAEGFQWFGIDFDGDQLASRQTGCAKARPVLLEFLTDLCAQTDIAPQQTLLVGFSQGTMMALHVGLSLPQQLMGIVAFSGSFLPPAEFGAPELAKPPVCLVHGDADTVVAPERSAEAETALKAAGVAVDYYVSPNTAHGISPDGLEFASKFIARIAGK
jgi:phospholipase/carboxylesterase|tara:strand:- start:61784 stop:62443 length:660 start_codon:yes stop_codon:yes gene_type:complete